VHLTQRTIEALAFHGAPGTRDVRWDEVLPNFGVRVYPSGRKTFVISYRSHGRKRLMTLGAYGVLTLEAARKRARSRLVAVSDGLDPLAEAERAARGDTVKAFCQEFLEKYSKLRKRSWKEDERTIDKQIVPRWGSRKLNSLKRADVIQAHRQLGVKHPYAANRFVELVSRVYEIARDWGSVEEGFPNPARKIKSFAEVKRDRFVTAEELPRLAAAIDAEPDPHVRGAFWLYLLTGLRKRELLRARWVDIDFTANIWRIPETKAGRVHYLPISERVIAVLSALPRVEDNPHVIPGLRAGRPLDDLKKPWQRIRERAGLPDVRIHDLRRTAGSHMAQQGVPLHLIARILNHKDPSTTAIYAHFQQRHESEALSRYADHLVNVSYAVPDTNVVAIRRG
jgi:integrase